MEYRFAIRPEIYLPTHITPVSHDFNNYKQEQVSSFKHLYFGFWFT